ncbi:MAG: SRPBCC domain-containing protein [Planctomycetota bacterium]
MSDGAAATVSVHVAVPPAVAFAAFTAEVDRWWRRGPKYRHADCHAGVTDAAIAIEPGIGGRVYESWRDADGAHQFELGRVTEWRPPARFAFDWRNSTFAPDERTWVEVDFAAAAGGTLVTVRHHGWTGLREGHPARHGADDAAVVRASGMWWGGLLMALRQRLAARPPE